MSEAGVGEVPTKKTVQALTPVALQNPKLNTDNSQFNL